MSATPLINAMNSSQQHHEKLDEFRQAYFYMRQEYENNKDKYQLKKYTESFTEILEDYNALSNNNKITIQQILPKKVWYLSKEEQISLSYYYLLESLNGDASLFPLLLGLHQYYGWIDSKYYRDKLTRSYVIENYKIPEVLTDNLILTPKLNNTLSLLFKQKKADINPTMLRLEHNTAFILQTFIPLLIAFEILFVCMICCICFQFPDLLRYRQTLTDQPVDYGTPHIIIIFAALLVTLIKRFHEKDIDTFHCNSNRHQRYKMLQSVEKLFNETSIITCTTKDLRYAQQYFEHLYFRVKKFMEQNKDESFVKQFPKTKEICLKKLLQTEDQFLFN